MSSSVFNDGGSVVFSPDVDSLFIIFKDILTVLCSIRFEARRRDSEGELDKAKMLPAKLC
jgi:hypothetical protein